MRKGSIGSVYNVEDYHIKIDDLNEIGKTIVKNLLTNKGTYSKARSVARYYLDMQETVFRCKTMLNESGMVFFVVGDTEYKGIKIENSAHLVQSLQESGFGDIKIGKRRISKKMLTPYRDKNGKFSSDKTQRTIYHEELIISGRV